MSSSSSPVRRRRPRRTPRGRNRPPQRVAFSTVVRSVLVVTAVSSVAIGTYFAFTQNTNEDNILELRAQIDHQYFDQKQIEQQLTALLQRQEALDALTSDLSATGTIKPERTAPTEPMPASPINDTVVAPPDREARSAELPARATTKHHRIYRAVRHHASLRHRVAPPATPAQQSPQLTSAIRSRDTSVADQ
jgi:hypothetical protein